MDSKKKCQKNSEKCQKFPELVTNFIRSFHYFNALLSVHSPALPAGVRHLEHAPLDTEPRALPHSVEAEPRRHASRKDMGRANERMREPTQGTLTRLADGSTPPRISA